MGESVYVGGGTTGYTVLQYSWRRGAWSTLAECPVRLFGLTQFTGRLTTVGGCCGVLQCMVYALHVCDVTVCARECVTCCVLLPLSNMSLL